MKTLKIALFVTAFSFLVVACSNEKQDTMNHKSDKTMEMEKKDGKMNDKDNMEKKDTMMDDKDNMEKKDGMMNDKDNMEKKDTMMDDKDNMEKKDGMMDDKDNMEKKENMDSMKEDKMKEMKNEGEMAFDFSLKDKNDEVFSLREQTGKKTYVKFWASWCSICLAGLEELNTLAAEDNDFQIVTVVTPEIRGEKSKEDFIKWFDTLGYSNVKVLFDEDGKVSENYMVRAYPTSAMIGSDGVLVRVQPGHIAADALKEAMAAIH